MTQMQIAIGTWGKAQKGLIGRVGRGVHGYKMAPAFGD